VRDRAAAGQPTFIWNINPEMAGHDNIFANLGAVPLVPQVAPYMAQQWKLTKVGVLGYGASHRRRSCAQGIKELLQYRFRTGRVL
jgi:hypothetical protein